jgi:hypothetical protein
VLLDQVEAPQVLTERGVDGLPHRLIVPDRLDLDFDIELAKDADVLERVGIGFPGGLPEHDVDSFVSDELCKLLAFRIPPLSVTSMANFAKFHENLGKFGFTVTLQYRKISK